MASERTEKATPKKRGDARNKGQVSKSQDLNMALTLAAGIYLIFIFMPSIFIKLKDSSISVFSDLDPNKIDVENLTGFLFPYLYLIFEILLPIMIPLVIVGILVNYIQIGPLFSLEAIRPKYDKLNPMNMISAFKKFFNLKSLVELAKSLIKLVIVGWVVYSLLDSSKSELLSLLGADPSRSLSFISSIIFKMITQICLILLILGILDKKYQAYEFDKSIKMTKEEVKDENKNSQGDPQVKAKIKSIQMQFAMQRMVSAIPTADVIITNPTHYAVALRYDTKLAPAPQVVAKGVDFVAFKIKEIAKHNNISIIENKPLARTLYKIVPLDGLIPAELYVAVAEVLAFVYKKNKGGVR